MVMQTKIIVRKNEVLGVIRAIHGVNRGPVDRYWSLNYKDHFKRLKIPSVRTHDCNFDALDVVDLHCIFPDPSADPEDPSNYRFALTDDYLNEIRKAGCEIYFRLGESIEGRMPRKAYVLGGRWKPEVLAKVCANIVRHYNQGWANGHKWGIRQWQFWNEPNNGYLLPAEDRPCWTGTTEEFYTLYGAVSRAIKQQDPAVKIGLAGFGRPYFVFPEGHIFYDPKNPWKDWQPIADSGPFDSISWHQYGGSWEDLALTTRQVRQFLDDHGFPEVENHLTEWNYMPRLEDEKGTYFWFDARKQRDFDRLDRCLEVMTRASGAAYLLGSLARLEQVGIDMAHLYTGTAEGALSLFDQHGRPYPKIVGLEVFSEFVGKTRIASEGGVKDQITSISSLESGMICTAIAHLENSQRELQVLFENDSADRIFKARQFTSNGWQEIPVGYRREGEHTLLTVSLPGPGITVIKGGDHLESFLLGDGSSTVFPG